MNRVVHFEIPAGDPEKSIKFYQSVFGWRFNQFATHDYWLVTTGADDKPGINGAIMKRNHPDQPVVNSIYVDDIDDAIGKIESSGGKIVVAKNFIPGVGWSAFFKDPDNNIFGLWQEEKKPTSASL